MKLLINIIFCSALLWGGTCICYAQNSSNLPLKIDENFIIGRLDNGLTYYIRKNTNPARHAEFFIVHNVGSLQEEDDQRGLAHFLEHMAFNGTKNFPNKNLLNSLNEIGVKFGSNVNAYTSMDRTVYNISQVPISRESVIDSVLLMLHDWSYYITCDSLAIESERGVIREEWRRGDDARTRMMKAFFAIEQKGSRFAERSPIGVPEVINNFKPRALRDFYHKWYRPDLQAIIVVGDVDPIFVENKIKSIFSSIPKSTNPAPKGIYLIPANDSLEVEYYSDKELKATSVRILTRFPVVDSDSRLTNSFLKERLIMEMLSEGFRSRLSNQIKGGENPYKAAIPTQGDIYYASRIFRLTAVQNGNNYNEALKGVIKDYLTLIKCGFTQDEFENMKSSKRADIIKRKSRNSIPKSIDFVNAAVETFTRGDVLIDIAKKDDLLVSILNDLSVNDINEFISTTFINIYPTIVFAGNDTDSIYFTPKEKVRFLYDSLMNANLEPNISVSSNDIIIKDVLEKKDVKYKGVDNKNKNISQFELFNGNRLLFINNPNIKSGDVKFYLIKKGGYSNVEDKDIFDARIMKMFLPNIQIGNLDKNSFFNYSKRNQFRLSFLLENRYSLVSGTFDRNRIEPFFKSLYAFIVYPNVCPKDFNRFKDQVIRQLYKGGANELFLDSCSNLSYNQTLLNKKLPKDKLESMVENDIQRVFKDIFCDIDNSTFIFEGNLNFEDLKPYIETYLSNLPYDSKPHIKPIFREPNWKDGEIYLKFNSNNPISSKASVTCNIKAKMPYNENNLVYSRFFNDILRERLMAKIREEKGGTYTIGVDSEFTLYPFNYISININFDTDPKLVDELVNCVWSELAILGKQGINDGEVERIRIYMDKKMNFVDDYIEEYSPKIISQILGEEYVDKRCADIVKKVSPKDLLLFIKSITKEKNYTTFIIEP